MKRGFRQSIDLREKLLIKLADIRLDHFFFAFKVAVKSLARQVSFGDDIGDANTFKGLMF